jgi:hypothetical protein
VIHGVEYGIAYRGGPGFRDDTWEIRVSGFGFRVGERFVYDDDVTDGWQLNLQVDRAGLAHQLQQDLPTLHRCSAGRPAGGLWRPWVSWCRRGRH